MPLCLASLVVSPRPIVLSSFFFCSLFAPFPSLPFFSLSLSIYVYVYVRVSAALPPLFFSDRFRGLGWAMRRGGGNLSVLALPARAVALELRDTC
ncbi:hypothetical protein ABB37_07721 [Leptomonas pyrrhocoris]|uniref:Uncharacterized protein n=1 Tax=Leptomonas pyrrhocoris TaxID=157538 RepID=A0A0M9FUS7_LEPPY|nr:hypothetical protein ABB37_07721 [Leptomonas pyrrhocoris]KPA76379.1 hypothetical protein ABB37_07721 [Leptomonas pyrrhocoris]|eukprot:XP_015654818.1 hypothetical protein ABB37_07721 [Leptomonas pyrrhocoris]